MRQVLANLLYYLIKYPSHLSQIREEIRGIDQRDYKAIQRLRHLNACINETLRLNPAVPSAGLRLPPKEGMAICNVFIPEGTTIVTPQYSMLRGKVMLRHPKVCSPALTSYR